MMTREENGLPKMTHTELAQRLGIRGSYLCDVVANAGVEPQRFGPVKVYSEEDFEKARAYLDSPRRGRRSDIHRPVGAEPADAYVSHTEAAELLAVNPRTVARWIELGKLQAWAQGLLRTDVEGLAAQLHPEARSV